MSRWLKDAPRWLLLISLVYAPWAYGSTRSWSLHGLNLLLGTLLGLWLVQCLREKTWPKLHPVLLGSCLWIVLQCWWMTLNASAVFDPAAIASRPLQPILAPAPGSIDRDASLATALRVTLILGTLLFACDFGTRPGWRNRLWWTIGLTGGSIVLLGLVQKLSNARGILWESTAINEYFFATYYYHANAGAYINLVWPLAAGLFIYSFIQHNGGRQKSIWVLCLAVCLAGLFVNTSRAASFIGVVLLAGLLGWLAWQLWRKRLGKIEPFKAFLTVGLVLVCMGALALSTGIEKSLMRWRAFMEQEVRRENLRLQAQRLGLEIVPDAGWFGFGPGAYPAALPRYKARVKESVRERIFSHPNPLWQFAHEDYLQILIEYGIFGLTAWALIIGGAFVQALRARFTVTRRWQRGDAIFLAMMLFAMAGILLHATVDYPLQIASLQLYVAVYAGLLWCAERWTPAPFRSQPLQTGPPGERRP